MRKVSCRSGKKMDLGSAVKFGKSESGVGADKPSILCDTYEAVLGAIYLDGGIEPARKWIMNNLKETIEDAKLVHFHNYKSEIQNYFQKRDKGTDVVTYTLVERKGPDHMPVFKVNAVYRSNIIGTGSGKNLKSAEQAAAKVAAERYIK